MTRLSFAASALLLAAPALAQQPWVDPRLYLLQDRPPLAFEAEPAPDRSLLDRVRRGRPHLPLAMSRGPDGAPRVALLVELRSANALAEMRALGAEIGTVTGSIATVRAPVAAVPALARLTSLRRIEAAHPMEPLGTHALLLAPNDSAASGSRLSEVRRRERDDFLGTTGRGVLVGVLDTGLDYLHGDFVDASGVPRAVAIWDQSASRFCDAIRIQERRCFTSDPAGHGTHVTGVAVADGSGVGADSAAAHRYAGAAPETGIMAVRYSFASNAELLDGVAWMFEQADSLGLPAVVNISLGSQFGPHDGTTLIEQGLDSLTGPGRIVVAAAGNAGDAANTSPAFIDFRLHAAGSVQPGQALALTFQISSYAASSNPCSNFALFDLWYGADQALTFTVTRPNRTSATAATGDTLVDQHATGRIVILAPDSVYPGNGDREALIAVDGCQTSGAPAPGTWQIELSSSQAGTEPVHVWMPTFNFGTGSASGAQGFDAKYVVASPGTARNVIAVGAYHSRACWPSEEGQQCTDTAFGFTQPLGDIAFFSSAGPSRDGRIKPELTAPGMLVISTKAENVQLPGELVTPDGAHAVEMGTSMSSPHVAGTVALLLEHDPTLTPDGVRAILTGSARSDAFTVQDPSGGSGGTPNDTWGYGKLDARAALETQADPAVAVELWLSEQSDTLPLGATLPVRAAVLNAFGDSLDAVDAWTSSDAGVAAVAADGTITPVAVGTATLIATGSGFSDSVFVEVVPPATLVVEASALAVPADISSARGTQIPLLALQLTVDGFEGILVDTLGFTVRGRDPGARFLLLVDANDDGEPDPGETALVDTAVSLTEEGVTIAVAPALVLAAHDSINLLAVIELSGAVPHAAAFQVVFFPELTSSEGLRSGAADRRVDPPGAVASALGETSVLEPDERFNLSENPVRSDARRLVLNFSEEPSIAALYTLRGVRVVDLLTRLDLNGLRVDWDLTNDEGGAVAPGVYFLLVRVGDELIRTKLIVARAYGSEDDA